MSEHATASRKIRRHSRSALFTVAVAGLRPRYSRSRYDARKRRASSEVILPTVVCPPRNSLRSFRVRLCSIFVDGARSPLNSRYIRENSASVTDRGRSPLPTRISACFVSAYRSASFLFPKLLLKRFPSEPNHRAAQRNRRKRGHSPFGKGAPNSLTGTAPWYFR